MKSKNSKFLSGKAKPMLMKLKDIVRANNQAKSKNKDTNKKGQGSIKIIDNVDRFDSESYKDSKNSTSLEIQRTKDICSVIGFNVNGADSLLRMEIEREKEKTGLK
ncbi:hypothetical protein L2E82_23222 [Cichorium intybus]|uniref:Uncharacterized protein n=1 Tax=Cichorium intybus TaxID=13427 RepID=A0ACB9DZZ5_CICIN|nr:hypothetical protein L2E82_23222 [Cichorium intybus]